MKSIIPKPFPVLFVLILLLGVFARVWEFGALPPGLNQDEASIGVEAFDLGHFGVDRNGMPFPVNFISWGNGMDALYGYVLIPFVAFGVNPITVRLPILLSGILTMPLVYFLAKRTLSKKNALLTMFFLAISPWHIILSRWGINENILPFVFLIGYVCLLKSRIGNAGFVIGCVFFGLSLYAYAAMYLAVPIFLASAGLILYLSKRVSPRGLAGGLLAFGALALPLALFVAVNTWRWDTLHLGPFSIPRLPVTARYQTMVALFDQEPIRALANNIGAMFSLLMRQSDGLIWNTVEPYGYFYAVTFPIALVGAFLLIPFRPSPQAPERWLLLAWLAASMSIGVLQTVNINRLDLIFVPLILCTANGIVLLDRYLKGSGVVVICVSLVAFAAFTRDYHGQDFRRQADKAFFAGLVPALDFARQAGDGPICVTDAVNMPYIFVLVSEPLKPAEYLDRIDYIDEAAEFRLVRSLGRYTFGLPDCPANRRTVYVLDQEQPPDQQIHYTVSRFGIYQVHVP